MITRQFISHVTKQNGVLLECALESHFKDIMNEMLNKIHTEYPEGSYILGSPATSYQHQGSQANKVASGIRQWYLHLKFISSGAYHALRETGIITLPSERTL